MNEKFKCIEILGVIVLLVDRRISTRDIPEGLYLYDIRHDDDGEFSTLEHYVGVNWAASVLSRTRLLSDDANGYHELQPDGYNFSVDCEECMTIEEFLTVPVSSLTIN